MNEIYNFTDGSVGTSAVPLCRRCFVQTARESLPGATITGDVQDGPEVPPEHIKRFFTDAGFSVIDENYKPPVGFGELRIDGRFYHHGQLVLNGPTISFYYNPETGQLHLYQENWEGPISFQLRRSSMTPFETWWHETGRFIDPDHSDVPWFDKRKGLAEYAFAAGAASRDADLEKWKKAADMVVQNGR